MVWLTFFMTEVFKPTGSGSTESWQLRALGPKASTPWVRSPSSEYPMMVEGENTSVRFPVSGQDNSEGPHKFQVSWWDWLKLLLWVYLSSTFPWAQLLPSSLQASSPRALPNKHCVQISPHSLFPRGSNLKHLPSVSLRKPLFVVTNN